MAAWAGIWAASSASLAAQNGETDVICQLLDVVSSASAPKLRELQIDSIGEDGQAVVSKVVLTKLQLGRWFQFPENGSVTGVQGFSGLKSLQVIP
jgi:hypothetical protein